MKSYAVIKIAIGIRMFPNLKAKQLAEQLKMPIKAIYTYYSQAEMYSRSWIPNLVTPEQLVQLSGAELTVLYYLYTAEPQLKISAHAFELGMADKTFSKALKKLREMDLIDKGIAGKLNVYNIKKLEPAFAQILN
jgi:predicted MarR family transcription regulator